MKMTTYELKKHLEKKEKMYKLEEMLIKLEMTMENKGKS